MALIPNPREARGVLFELTALAASPRLSRPLRALFDLAQSEPRQERPRTIDTIPAVLSEAQQRAVRSAASYPLTLVVGPPETGKSYTAAVLALDHLVRGESVLIAGRTRQSLDVIARKFEEIAGQPVAHVRGGRKECVERLQATLEKLLSESDERGASQAELAEKASEVTALRQRMERAERSFQKQLS
jgi:hypothetical protein